MSALFSPIRLRGLDLPNRVMVSPMCQYSAVDGCMQAWHQVHLGQLAMGGAGLLMIEAAAVEPIGRITPGDVGLYDDATEAAMRETLAVMRQMVPQAHQPLAIQIAHAGRKAASQVPWDGGQQLAPGDGGWESVSSGNLPHLEHETPPRALDQSGLDALKQRFVDCVVRADRLGFDAAEMHAAHGYLMHQFLSPVANNRDDQYGGSLENRMRWPLEVLRAMRAAWPAEKPLGVRISATDWDPDSSWTIDESVEFSKACEAAGADWIDVSSGGVSRHQKIELAPGYQVPFAARIKQAVSIPVIAVGLITEAGQAEQIIASGQADIAALARAFLYNPRWVWHAAQELGGKVNAPPQYWRSEPREARGVFANSKTGQR